ncbi:MAG: PIN domain-containing protein [Anaerolineae bacterium]|nr:PIN domain-containing protein [Anaerolineae bacterium]
MNQIIDTSFLFALTNRNDKNHLPCLAVAQRVKGRLIIPVTVLPEIAYLLDVRLGHQVMRQFVAQITQPTWTLESVQSRDLSRAAALLEQYADARLDFVDATLVAIAERLNVNRLLSLDQRHYRIIRPIHCSAFEILP